MYYFGPYEDAMTRNIAHYSTQLCLHLVNLGRIMPSTLLNDALALDIPLNSEEGFVRQIIGWREFVQCSRIYVTALQPIQLEFKARPAAGWEGECAQQPKSLQTY